MKRRILLPAIGFLLAAGPALAGYADLVKEVEDYQPPTLLNVKREAAPPPEGKSVSAGDHDLETRTGKFDEVKASWEKALLAPAEGESFYKVDQGLMERLKPAISDSGFAERELSDGFSLETLEGIALLRNPSIASKEWELRGVLEGYSQLENVDSILRRYSTLTSSLMTGVGSMENPDSISAKFPFPGVLALKGQIVSQEAAAMGAELEIARRTALTSVRKAYWEMVYVDSAREVMARMLDLMINLKAAVSARYEAGDTSFQDVVRIAVEREKTAEGLRTMIEERRNMEAMIREVLNLPHTAAIGTPAARNPSGAAVKEDSLYPMAREKRQELVRMRAMLGKMERMLQMNESMVYPGVSLGLSSFERKEISKVGANEGMGGQPEGNFPVTTTASMGEGQPKMPWYGRDAAYLGELRQKVQALKKDLEMEEAATAQAVHLAWFGLDKARREKALYSERITELSKVALTAATGGYSAGTVMFSDLIESYTGWFAANLSAQRARADTGIARAELEAAVGASLAGLESTK